MTHDPIREPKRGSGDRPFPWRCPRCLALDAVHPETVVYSTEIEHEGRSYKLAIPDLQVPRCSSCRELIFSHAVDQQIRRAFRAHLHLLDPEQIGAGRKALGMSVEDLAERLGVAREIISRCESGDLIQTRAMDNLLRVYFAIPQVRAALQGSSQDPSLGILVGHAGQQHQASLVS